MPGWGKSSFCWRTNRGQINDLFVRKSKGVRLNRLQQSILIGFLFASQSTFAQVSFSAKTDFTTGRNSNFHLSIGDLNGDGKPDIAVANYKSNTMSIFLNTTVPGVTVPSFSTRTDFKTGERPSFRFYR